jgi:NADH dehydrogenase
MTAVGRRVTVFGGSGFIGRYVVRRLAQQGWVVRVAVRDSAAALFLKPMGDVGQIVPMHVDIRDAAAVALALDGAHAAINLVGILFERGRRSFQAVHADGPAALAQAAVRAGVTTMVHLSAIGADPASASRYAQSKAAGESAVRQHMPAATILRPSVVFGPEDQFFNRFAAMARFSPALPLIGGGQTRFQPVYVGDVADAVMKALADPAAQGRTFELGGPRTYTFRALMEYVLAVTNRKRWLVTLPFGLAQAQAAVLEWLPTPPLTRDQVTLLRRDNVVAAEAAGFAALGIEPTPLETVVPGYLAAFRRPSA